MPPKGRTQGKQKRYDNLSKMHEQNRVLSQLELKLVETKKACETVKRKIFEKDIELSIVSKQLLEKNILSTKVSTTPVQEPPTHKDCPAFSISQTKSNKRKLNPTSHELPERAKVTRSAETLDAVSASMVVVRIIGMLC